MKLDAIERTVQKTHAWLNGIGEGLPTQDERVSYHALRAVLHAIRDRLSVEDACGLGAQLPLLVRGIYYEGWHAHGKPLRVRKADDFIELVAQYLADDSEIRLEPRRAVDAVFATLKAHTDPGEINKLVHSMPPDIQTVFTRPAAAAPSQ